MENKELPLKTIMDIRHWASAGIPANEIAKKVNLPMKQISKIISHSHKANNPLPNQDEIVGSFTYDFKNKKETYTPNPNLGKSTLPNQKGDVMIVIDVLNNWRNDNNRETISAKSFKEVAEKIIVALKANDVKEDEK